ncbi:MAG: hypothetical protein LBG29_06685 [Synergistaceae bacterium]|nr:hypothetical protein [Synergistaceae bacterium]
MTSNDLSVSRGKKAAVTLFPFLVSALLLIPLLASAQAASRPSLAIAPPQGEDLSYLYADMADAGKIARRLQKSEAIKSFFEPAKAILEGFPATEMSFMMSVSGDEKPSFQMAWGLGREEDILLERIAQKSASSEELEEFFGRMSNLISVLAPDGETPFYRIDPFGLYFSSDGKLLIFASSEEGVKKSMLAAGNSYRRFSPKTKSSGRNVMLLGLGKEPSAFFAENLADVFGMEDWTLFPENISAEAHVSLTPGGWELDLLTDLVKPIYGDGFFGRSVPKPYGSFFRSGGGRLVAAVDGIPNPELVLTGGYVRILSSILGDSSGFDASAIETLMPERASGHIVSALESAGRMNFAVTATPDGDLSGYFAVSGAASGDWKKAGDEISRSVTGYNETDSDGAVKIKEIPGDGWDRVFSITPEGGPGQASLTVAFHENRAFAGFVRPDLLKEPFIADSEFYEALTKDADVMENLYADMRFLRKTLRAKAPGRYYDGQAALIMISLLDFREIGAQTLSPEHFKFFFKTGWPDLDEREFIQSISR